MKRTFFVLGILLAGCSVHHPPQQQYNPALLPPTPPLANTIEIPPEVAPALLEAWREYKRSGKSKAVSENGTTRYAYSDGLTLRCQVMRIIDLEFSEGENIGNVVIGNPDEWQGQKSASGEGATRREHIALSPKVTGAKTTILIYTSKRTYSLVLREGPNEVVRIGWWFPEEVERQVRARERALAQSQIQQVRTRNGNYGIDGDAVWKPVSVFDDGQRTYVLFPESVQVNEMPIFYVTIAGKDELVNSNVQWPYLIIGRLFDRGVLLLRVGRQQERVSIWKIE